MQVRGTKQAFLLGLLPRILHQYTEAKYKGIFWKFVATVLAGCLLFFSAAFSIAVYVIMTGPPTLNDVEKAYLERFRQGQRAIVLHEQIDANHMIDTEHTLYSRLHITPDASMNDIAHAYHKLAKMFHPDRNKSPHAEKIFRGVAEAYETLKDPNKRAEYDMKLAANKDKNRYSSDPSVSMHQAREIFQMFEQMFAWKSPFGSMIGVPSMEGNVIVSNSNNPIHAAIPGIPSAVMPILQMMGGMPNVKVAYNNEMPDGYSVSKLCYDDENGTHCKLRVIRRTPE